MSRQRTKAEMTILLDRMQPLWEAGLSTSEIGLKLGIPKGTVGSTSKRYRDRFPKRPDPSQPGYVAPGNWKPTPEQIEQVSLLRRRNLDRAQIAATMGVTARDIELLMYRKVMEDVRAPAEPAYRPAPKDTLPLPPSLALAPLRPIRPIMLTPIPPPYRCCWPLNDWGERFISCDTVLSENARESGRPYCQRHSKIAYLRNPKLRLRIEA